MTTNVPYLHEQLSKRIAHGRTSAQDLPLLNQLLVCQQRRFLMFGAATGVGIFAAVQLLLALIV